jgi:8-oxo-dGTP diphosphatase
MNLVGDITSLIAKSQMPATVRDRYTERLHSGNLTRAENPVSHFCAYFLPYDMDTKKVFFVHHKKSGLWLSPGGHIEKDETLFDTLTREIKEELGMANPLPTHTKPQLFTVTDIIKDTRACKVHFDIWFFMPNDGKNFIIGKEEFHDTQWVSIDEAREKTTDPNNLRAIDLVENNLLQS